MSWSDAYIGIPEATYGHDFDGCNCWGLAKLVYGRELGITLPSYRGFLASREERTEIDSLIGDAALSAIWKRQERPGPFDLMLYRRGNLITHIGIHVSRRRMLHVASGSQSRIDDPDGQRFKVRHMGDYRHVETSVEQVVEHPLQSSGRT